jgi:hypothetical protein
MNRPQRDAWKLLYIGPQHCIDFRRQYLAKNPGGYCPNHSCGVSYAPSVS